jgi:hypothetical protein
MGCVPAYVVVARHEDDLAPISTEEPTGKMVQELTGDVVLRIQGRPPVGMADWHPLDEIPADDNGGGRRHGRGLAEITIAVGQ